VRVLVVEDDIMLGEGISEGLKQNGFTVDLVRDGLEGEDALLMNDFDIAVLDIGLPGQDGITLLNKVRKKSCATPILLLTARDEIDDRVRGLDAGADDYLTKPFDLSELCARLRALVRRSSGRSDPVIKYEDIEVNPASHTVTKSGESVNLSRREFDVFCHLLESVGKVVSKSKLDEKLYGWNEDVDSNALEVHIHHIRKKLGNKLIRTVRGVGYFIKKEG
jgi:two-component system, OmpR family, response regulator QseB